MSITLQCSRCGGARSRDDQRYCAPCHAAYMRGWRKENPLTGESKRRSSVRSTAKMAKRRGTLQPEPCICCGAVDTEMHHPDYQQPLLVEWLCRSCHLDLHYPKRREKLSSGAL